MDSSEEYEDEEEALVLLEVQGIMETGFLSNVKQAKAMCLGTDKPMLQLDDYTFSGEYQDTVGTCMFFEETTKDEQTQDNIEEERSGEIAAELRNKELKYSCLTNKKICFERIFINQNPETSTGAEELEENTQTQKDDTSADKDKS